ncbi:hypothetical protein FHG87_017574 [Trinorchestia longiramus]|nr:hypothetical protein FHG87_017574 [Trinorchestia longiramus]
MSLHLLREKPEDIWLRCKPAQRFMSSGGERESSSINHSWQGEYACTCLCRYRGADCHPSDSGPLSLPPTDYPHQYFTQTPGGGVRVVGGGGSRGGRGFSPLRLPLRNGDSWKHCSWQYCALAFILLSIGNEGNTRFCLQCNKEVEETIDHLVLECIKYEHGRESFQDVVREQYGEKQKNARCVEEDSGIRHLIGLGEECNMNAVDAVKNFLVYAWSKKH